MASLSQSRRLIILIAGVFGAIAAGWALLALVFGGSADAETDSNGAPISTLPADTTMGAVDLRVGDLAGVAEFYATGVGLDVLEESTESVLLGIGGLELIRLHASVGETPSPTQAGLFHTAILYAEPASLANAIVSTVNYAPTSFQGSSDHRVSQAFYFADPEGNGLELYIDVPRDDWVWEDGQVQMGSYALDPNAFVSQHAGQAATNEATMGHVHLRVGELDAAREFYVDTLGFAVTSESEGATFMSAGGYHHHLAVNIWNSEGAGPRSPGLGLGSLTVELPDASALDAAESRITAADVSLERSDQQVRTRDPWGNEIVLNVGTG